MVAFGLDGRDNFIIDYELEIGAVEILSIYTDRLLACQCVTLGDFDTISGD